LEVIEVYRVSHSIVFSRGFLIGPYLPIFGFGAVLMIYILEPYKNDYVVLFVLGLVICCLLEYFTSLIMEKIFKLRWWDYSDMRFNINGRVCLETGVKFGLGGIIIVKFFNPILISILSLIPYKIVIILGVIISIIMITDFIISNYTILQLKLDLSFFKEKDCTIRIKKEIMDSILKYQFFHKRLFKAFPNITRNKYVVELQRIVEKSIKKSD
jgi:uncharacterized membrane protein